MAVRYCSRVAASGQSAHRCRSPWRAHGRSALLAARGANHIEIGGLLIECSADVNTNDDQRGGGFLYAAAEGRLEILHLTLIAGADLSSANRYGGTVLIPAAQHSHVETVRDLPKTTVDVDHVNRPGWTALLEAIIRGVPTSCGCSSRTVRKSVSPTPTT